MPNNSPQPFWTVVEIQEIDPDSRASSTLIYSDYNEALAQYYTICAAAARSNLPYHAAVIIPSTQPFNKQLQDWQIFERRVSNG